MLNVICLSPRAHDPCIVECNDGDDVNALGFDLGEILNVTWQVACGATRCKGAYTRVPVRPACQK